MSDLADLGECQLRDECDEIGTMLSVHPNPAPGLVPACEVCIEWRAISRMEARRS
jgi:hypothetical protein